VIRRPVVLAYHGVNAPPADDPLGLVMTPEHLASQIATLRRLGYRFRTAGELADGGGGPPPPGTAVLTFDDGWRDALTVVAPLLERAGVRATFYVNPGHWGGRHHEVGGEAGRLLDAADARALAEAGMELGCHALEHRDLRGLGDAELAHQVEAGRAGVEEVTGRPCRTFAYPFGAHDPRVEVAVAAAGFELAFAWLPGPWRAFAAPRLPAPTRGGGERLLLSLLGVRRRRTVGPPPAPAASLTT
jgi:peptidoglycan/xylan/chitin deacetylase (PgdA/CDA1 family)